MALGQRTQKTYLSIAYGKLRQKANATDKGAVPRTTDKGETTYAFEYSFLEGKIVGVYYRESSEYGNSYEVTFEDNGELYQVSFKEASKYGMDFISKLPNIDITKPVKIVPYSMKSEDGKEIHGVSVQQFGVKLPPYFVKKKEDGTFEFLHGFPPRKNKMTEKEYKIWVIQAQDFLAEFIKKNIIPKFKQSPIKKEEVIETPADDDAPLPF